jgi:hypothetical protein
MNEIIIGLCGIIIFLIVLTLTGYIVNGLWSAFSRNKTAWEIFTSIAIIFTWKGVKEKRNSYRETSEFIGDHMATGVVFYGSLLVFIFFCQAIGLAITKFIL